jgi:hypothetical protein
MSDFDAVLERLLTEPSFAAALAADPDATLSGYRLDAGEVELLRSQVSADSGGGSAAVETRTNKSSTFGLFSAFADIGHSLSGAGSGGGAAQGFGDAPGGGSGGGSAGQPWQPSAHSGFGSAPHGDGGDGVPSASSGLGDAPRSGLGGPQASESGLLGRVIHEAEQVAPPKGYHPHIDANGDGHWDKATFIGTKGDGVEILVDVNHDGHADFVGHDTNGDGLVDYADYDKDDNGVFEKRMYDVNGDGWLDRTVWHKDR